MVKSRQLNQVVTGGGMSESAEWKSNHREILRCPSCGSGIKLIGTLERERPGRLSDDLRIFDKAQERELPISLGAEMEVCPRASKKVDSDINAEKCVRLKMKPSNRPPGIGNGKLAAGPSRQRDQTEQGLSRNVRSPLIKLQVSFESRLSVQPRLARAAQVASEVERF